MVSRNNAVFRFILDIKDFLNKGRQVSQVLNKISGDSHKASSSVEQLGTATQKTGQNMTAAAVNFQTATQGMLNLTTATVQTITSFSNLDRAGNRLAQAQIAVSRSQDLLNNKQLRLNELQAAGAGHTQKAVNLTNELATARADLLVKSDKLKIEEGALLDIQMLFATNIANVMISSLQTIKTLKDLHVASTIKQVIQEKLLSTTIFTKSVPSWVALSGTMGGYDIVAKKVINTNRLLMVGIPVLGGALLGISLAVQAYTENWGGFRDMIQKVLPFMRDQKALLGDVQEELGKAGDAADGFTDSLDKQSEILFRLPQQYRLAKETVESYARAYGAATKEAHKLNVEVGKNPQVFRQASSEGGIIVVSEKKQPITSSNVIKHEGDSRFTASSISNSSMNMDVIRFMSANAIASVNPRIAATPTQPLVANFNNEIFRKDSLFDYLNFFEPSTRAAGGVRDIGSALERQIGGTINTIDQTTKQVAFDTNLLFKLLGVDLRIPTSFGDFFNKLGAGLSRDIIAVDAASRGVNLKEFEQITAIQNKIKSQIGDNFIPFTLQRFSDPNRSRGQFVGGGAFFPGVTSGGFLGTEQLKAAQENRDRLLQELHTADPARAFEITMLLNDLEAGILKATTDPNIAAGILLQDKLRKQANLETFIVDPDNPQAFQDYMSNLAKKRSDVATRNLMQVLEGEIKQTIQQDLVRDAAALGLTPEDLVFRRRVGGAGGITPGIAGIGKDIFMGFKPTSDQLSFLESAGKVVRYMGSTVFGGQDTFKPKKVLEALAIREQELAGNNLADNTPHDRLVKAAFGAKNMFGPGQRFGFKFGSAGGTLNMAYSGLILSKDDPLLKDTSNMGETQLAVFMETGVDIGGVAETIGKKEALRIAHLDKQMQTFANTTGGFSSAAISYLNMVGKTNEWGKSVADNNIRSHMANIYRTGDTSYFGSGFFKSTGATAAYQVARGSIKVPAWVRENIARKNAFGKSEDFLWYNALRGLAGEKTGAMGRTLADKVARGDARGPNLSGGMGLLSFFGLDAEIQGEASEALASINLNDPNASSLIRSAVNRINNNIKTKTASISAVPGSIGIDFKVGEFERVAVGARSRTIRRGTSRLTRTVYRYGDRLKRAFSPAEIERQIRQDIMWGGFTLTSGFLDNVQLLAEMGSTNFNNTGIISEASAKLNLNENQVFNIRFNPQRGDIELQDRIRWTDRLNTISTGAIVI